MKENRNSKRATGTRTRTKRYFAAVIAIVLTLALSNVALADSGKTGGQPGAQQSQQPKGNDPQSGTTPSPDMKSENGNEGRNVEMTGVNVDKIEAAIAALTDTDVQESLTALLDAYVAALEAKQTAIEANETDLTDLTSAVTAAKAALDAALEDAGVSTDTIYGVPEEANDGTGRMNNQPALDTDEIAAAIAALDDSDENKATLTALLAAYEEALAAVNDADTSSLTDDELEALQDALDDAEDALLAATKDAGVTGGVGRGQFVNGYANGNTVMNTTAIAAQIAGLSDTNENKVTLQELLAAYEEALAAQQGADTANLTEDELAALSDATEAAAEALKTALENAGVDTEIQTQQQAGNEYQLRVVSNDGDGTSAVTSSIVSSFLQWLGTLFK